MSVHLFLAHFPLALIVVGAGADLLGAATGRESYRRWAGGLLMLGALGAFLAFFSGSGAMAGVLSRPNPDYRQIEVHTQWAGAGVWLLVGAGLLRAAWRNRLQGTPGWLTLAAAVLSAVLVVAIAASGYAISHVSRTGIS